MLARLLETHEIAPEVRHFLFEIPELDALKFTPGQFVSISAARLGKRITRAYSIASAPGANRFELCLNRVLEGRLSPWLFDLRPGEPVEIRGPLGHFVPRTPFRDAVLVATGTGIAPFRSFLQSPPVLDSGARIALLFGARHEEGLLYRKEFESLAEAQPCFTFLPTLTRPGPGWTGRTGRVQAHLDEALAGRRDVDVYICGLKAMVNDVRHQLHALGFEKSQIVFEKYD
jgi:CDP-4-dehydro-6-deoxyglucose reductase